MIKNIGIWKQLLIVFLAILMVGTLFMPAVKAEDKKLDVEETVTNSNNRPVNTVFVGDTLTVKIKMNNYNDLEGVTIDNSQLEFPINTDILEYIPDSVKTLLNDPQANTLDTVYRERDNRIVFMYVSKSSTERMPKPNSDLFEFQVKVKDTAKIGDIVKMNIDSENSYFALNSQEDLSYSFKNPELIVNEFQPLVVKTEPKVEYIEGQAFDPTGGVLTYSSKEGIEEDIALDDAAVTITGYNKNPSTYGKQTLTIAYKGEKTTLNVNVAQKQAESIEVVKAPSPKPVDVAAPQVNYIEGQDWGILNDGTLKVVYNNGTTEIVTITAEMIPSAPSLMVSGSITVNVEYLGVKTAYAATVEPKKALSISLKPSAMNLKVNSTFKAADVKVITKYNNGKPDTGIELDVKMLDKLPDMTKVGAQVLIVTYNGKTAELTVNVQEKELVGVEVKESPKPTQFIESTKFTAAGGKLTLKYDNNTTEVIDINPAWVTGPKMDKVGPAKALVKYDVYTVEYPITIVAASVDSISILKTPKTDYIEGQTLDVTGGTIKAIMNNGTKKTVDITVDMCKGFDASKPVQNQKVTVTYGNKTTFYNVNIVAKKVTGITINENPQKEYFVGDKIDMSVGSFKVTYDNGLSSILPIMGSGTTAKGFDSSKAGIGTVTLTYEGKSVSFEVTYMTKDRVNTFIKKVSDVNIDTLTLNDKAMVMALKAEYDALTNLEKGIVPKDTLDHLNKMISKINSLSDPKNNIEKAVAVNNPTTGLNIREGTPLIVMLSVLALAAIGTGRVIKRSRK